MTIKIHQLTKQARAEWREYKHARKTALARAKAQAEVEIQERKHAALHTISKLLDEGASRRHIGAQVLETKDYLTVKKLIENDLQEVMHND